MNPSALQILRAALEKIQRIAHGTGMPEFEFIARAALEAAAKAPSLGDDFAAVEHACATFVGDDVWWLFDEDAKNRRRVRMKAALATVDAYLRGRP
jgi:hypothetical protein